jgi:hypothetical protein
MHNIFAIFCIIYWIFLYLRADQCGGKGRKKPLRIPEDFPQIQQVRAVQQILLRNVAAHNVNVTERKRYRT